MLSLLKFITILSILMLACGGRPPQIAIAENSDTIPETVFVETEIAGEYFGQPMRQPVGVEVNRRGDFFLSDAGNQRVLQLDRDFGVIREIGGPGRDPGEFDRPGFIALDNSLNLFIVDGGNRRIDRYDSKLNYVNEIRFFDDADPLKYGEPSGLALTEYGELWISDRTNNRIVVFDNIGRFDRFVGDFGYPGGQLNSPENIAVDIDGSFVVCDGGNARLIIYDSYGNFSHAIQSDGFQYPISVAVSAGGYWMLDGVNSNLFFLNRSGETVLRTGPLISGTTKPLLGPTDIALLPDGRLIIADSGNNRLLILSIVMKQ